MNLLRLSPQELKKIEKVFGHAYKGQTPEFKFYKPNRVFNLTFTYNEFGFAFALE